MCRWKSLAIILSIVVAHGSGECHAGGNDCESHSDATSLLQLSDLSITQDAHDRSNEGTRERSIQLARHLALAAKKLPAAASVTKSLLESFRVCAQCNHFERFGESHDGGYLTCMDGLQNGAVQAVYSLGVEHHDRWSEQVGKALSVPVNQFDCTVGSSSCGECAFFKRCIVTADGLNPVQDHENEGWSLKQALQHTSQSNAADGSLLMKMDIESSEWPIYASEPSETLKKFGQIIVEFHELTSEHKHPMYLQAMKNILGAGFRIAHLHGNNNGGMYHFQHDKDELSIPQVLEVTFVTRAPELYGGCLHDQIYDALDAPNKPTESDLPIARMR